MTTCKEWTQPDGDHFRGLCTNEFWPKPGSGGCNLCVGPQVVQGVCDSCNTLIVPRTYRAIISIDGNGAGAGNTDYGCGTTDYNKEFLLYSTGGCTWESEEIEKYCESANSTGTDPVTCGTTGTTRARIVLTVSTRTSMTPYNTVYTVAANWRTDRSAVGAVSVSQCTVRSQGFAFSCQKPAACPYFNRSLQFDNSLPPFGWWANPMRNFNGGGNNITMTAEVWPL